MDLLPQMCSEYLDKRDLQCWNLSMQEYTCQIQLDLETDVNVGSVNCSYIQISKIQWKRENKRTYVTTKV
jgi:hypothetical protein